MAYIYQIKSGWGIPLANEGWCTFHPPLYYFIMSGIWKILGNKSPWPVHIILRLFSTLMNLAIALLVFLSIRLLWPKKSLILLLGICFFISGGFYVRNMLLFGRIFVLGQNYPVVDEVMKQQPPGERRCSDFLGFDLRIFYNPIVLDPQEGISIFIGAVFT